jgi:hypothetical protein
MLAFCIIALALAGLVQPKEFQIINRGSQTIWIGILGNEVLERGGFALTPGQQVRRKTSTPRLQITPQRSSAHNLTTPAFFQFIHCEEHAKLSRAQLIMCYATGR